MLTFGHLIKQCFVTKPGSTLDDGIAEGQAHVFRVATKLHGGVSQHVEQPGDFTCEVGFGGSASSFGNRDGFSPPTELVS